MASATITRSSRLPASPDAVWAALKRAETFAAVVHPIIGAPAIKRIDALAEPGLSGTGWLFLFHVVPMYRHTIEVVAVDERARRMETAEHGGVLRSWRHVLTAEPDGDGTLYRDEVTLDAGPLTPVAAAITRAIFRYRHRRWARLVHQLAPEPAN